MTPLVSVIVPFYNRSSELFDTLKSLAQQTMDDFELVVVDDASREDPTPIIRSHMNERKARIVRHTANRGPSSARNTGIDIARGKYVAFLDSDDSWHREKLAAQIAAVEKTEDPEGSFCVTLTKVVRGKDRQRILPARSVKQTEDFAEFLYVAHGFAQTSSFLLARKEAAEIRFAENLRQYEDHLFFISAGARGLKYLLVDEPLVTWFNDDRLDRAGRQDDLARARLFLDTAGELMSPKARLAFCTRYLGRLMFKERPLKALDLFRRAYRERAVSGRDLLKLAARCAVPPEAYELLRRSFAV